MTSSAALTEQVSTSHFPVLLKEVLEYLQPKEGGKYLDCTYGAGGYSNAILKSCNCHLTALDQDPSVSVFSSKTKEAFGSRFEFIETNFANSGQLLSPNKYDGIVLDLGVSSMQLDQGKRGFSFSQDGPLDMRMSNKGESAADFIASASEEEIAAVIYKYGDEVQSRQIARNIVIERAKEPITTTLRFAEIVRAGMHFRKAKIDPATKTFQAIRIYINKELESLEFFLQSLLELLAYGGRILIVSFHSLEDSIVKKFFKEHSAPKVARSKYAKAPEIIDESKWLKVITKKSVAPSSEELKLNHRSRSAHLRVAEKILGGDR